MLCTLAPKMPQSSIDLDKHFLCNILRIGAIARIAHRKIDYPGSVLDRQLVERPTVTRLCASHEAQIM
jgi:hypothetical protein